MNFFNIKNNKQYGFALLETIFYICLFALLSIVVINSIITMAKSFKEITIQSELAQGADLMERISREIKQASGINSINSSFLKLNTKDASGVDKTVSITLSGTDVSFSENDTFVGNLNTQNLSVTSLDFSSINTVKGSAVKVSMTLKSNHDLQNRTENFYDTIVLRGDY